MKKRELLILAVGFFAGVLFALFDTATNNVDVAPVDSGFDFLFSELIKNFDILKVIIYGIIGLIITAASFIMIKF